MKKQLQYLKEKNVWEIQVPCLDEEKGTIFYKSYQYDSENIAKENLEKYEDNYLNTRKYIEAKFGMKYSFKEYINYWHDKIMPVWTQSQAYINCLEWTIDKIIFPNITEDILLNKITPTYINTLLEQCQNNSKDQKSNAYMARKVCRIVLKSALMEGYISKFDLNQIKNYDISQKIYVKYDVSDLKKLLAYAQKENGCYLEILLCLFMGLRTGEVLGLNFDNIDFGRHTIRICQQISTGDRDGVVKPVKSSDSNRLLKAPNLIMDELAKRKTKNALFFKQNPKAIKKWKKYVCIGENGNIKSSNTIRTALQRYCKYAGVPYITPHQLRHLCATMLIESGVDLESVSKIMGHASVSTTINIYCGEIESGTALTEFVSNNLNPINIY